jgi:beta-galactosidase
VKLKRGCLHPDNGLLGAAAIDRAEERKVELMKANGYNAVRCSHNLPSEAFLDACDRLGMLVMDEAFDQWLQAKRPQDYHQYFEKYSEADWTTMLRRDRNHPSIILWSIGNEIAERADSIGNVISKRLADIANKVDGSRPTTIACNQFWDRRQYTWDDSERAFRNVDVAGYNYYWQAYESDHAKHPARIIVGTESYPKETAQNWNLIDRNAYLIGDFVWTSVDYLGEAGLAHTLYLAPGERNTQFMGWPWYNAWCGDIDLIGQKKPQSFYRDIVWKRRDISMAVQPPVPEGKRERVNGWGWKNELLSWTWPAELEGKTMSVHVYSRSPRVRLYLNGTVVGEKEVDPESYTATFEVTYTPGTLRAVNLKGRREAAAVELATTGAVASIRLTPDRTALTSATNDLSYVLIELLDAQGRLVTTDDRKVTLACEGDALCIGGNGGYDDMESFRSATPRTFRGQAVAIVQPRSRATTLTVSAEGLGSQSITINIKP